MKAFAVVTALVTLAVGYGTVALATNGHWAIAVLIGITAAQMCRLIFLTAGVPYASDVADETVTWHGLLGTRKYEASAVRRFSSVARNSKSEYIRVDFNDDSRSIRIDADKPTMLLMHYLVAAHPHIELDVTIRLPKRQPEGFYAE